VAQVTPNFIVDIICQFDILASVMSTQQLIKEAVAKYCGLSEELHGIIVTPKIEFKLRGRSVNAWANRYKNLLNFNLGAANMDLDRYLATTVPHEVAHLVAPELHSHRIRPHGREWKNVMHSFGVKPDRCNSYGQRPAFKQQRHAWHCACQQHDLSTTVHNRMMGGQRRSCTRCKKSLTRGPYEVRMLDHQTGLVVGGIGFGH